MDVLYLLSRALDRRDVVTFVRSGLTVSNVIKVNKKHNLYYKILERGGIVWLDACLYGLTKDETYDVGVPRIYIDDYWNAFDYGDGNHEYYIVSARKHIGDAIFDNVYFYPLLVVYGVACDVDTIQHYVNMKPGIFRREDVKRICNIFIDKYGDNDPIALILAKALQDDKLGGYVREYTDALGNTLRFTDYGTFLNDRIVLSHTHDTLTLEEGTIRYTTSNGFYLLDPIPEAQHTMISYEAWFNTYIVHYDDGTSYNEGDTVNILHGYPCYFIRRGNRIVSFVYRMGDGYYVDFAHYSITKDRSYYLTIDGDIHIMLDNMGVTLIS